MTKKYTPPFKYDENDPEFEFLVNISGALVPIAKIIIIGEVVHGISELELEDGSLTPLWGFPIMLTDSRDCELAKDNPQMLFDTWDTQEEAEEQRRNLAIQVENYYKKLTGN
jgi:hypothetical protein